MLKRGRLGMVGCWKAAQFEWHTAASSGMHDCMHSLRLGGQSEPKIQLKQNTPSARVTDTNSPVCCFRSLLNNPRKPLLSSLFVWPKTSLLIPQPPVRSWLFCRLLIHSLLPPYRPLPFSKPPSLCDVTAASCAIMLHDRGLVPSFIPSQNSH